MNGITAAELLDKAGDALYADDRVRWVQDEPDATVVVLTDRRMLELRIVERPSEL